MDTNTIRERIRRLIASGQLPRAHPRTILGGRATEERSCAACALRILFGAAEIEADCVDDLRRAYHALCFHLLSAERDRGAAAP